MRQEPSSAVRHLKVVEPSARCAEEADDFVPILLSIAKRTRALFGCKLAEAGFHAGQDHLLVTLKPDDPFAVSALAESLDVRPSTVSKMVDRLVDKGLVERIGNTGDARKTMIRITPAGLEARTLILRIWEGVSSDFFSALGNCANGTIAQMRILDKHLSTKLMRLR